ncbi:MAG: pantoate--beta-alanine ligase, partial [Rhizobiales bacterium 35-66-30]
MAGKPEVVETVDALRAQVAAWRAAGEKVALVPTMGALHEGHIALVRQAKTLARRIVVSIFVNPTQFAPNEDFSRYPRTFDNDLALLAAEGVDVVYAPSAADMYPQGFATHFAMGGPALGLETDFRTHFFAGVAIVVSKLLIRTGPDYAMFGEKDYQQLKVVTRLA